jgi:hypothetical protein
MAKINETHVVEKLEAIVEQFLDEGGWRRGFLKRNGYMGKMSAAELSWAGKHLSLEVCIVTRSNKNKVTMGDGVFFKRGKP